MPAEPVTLRARVIVNCSSGGAQSHPAVGSEARLAELFHHYGVQASVRRVTGPELHEELKAAQADAGCGRHFDIVVVGGGDGTVSAAAGTLVATGIPLGILPLGTLNHFAKDLGLPLALGDAVAAIAAGHTREVDVAELNGRVFVNNSSIGLYADMVADREAQQRKTGRGKWSAMVLAWLAVLKRCQSAPKRDPPSASKRNPLSGAP